MADALGTPPAAATPTVGVVSDEDHRLAMAGLIAPQTSSLAVRTGVLWGPGSTAIITGTSATGTMTVNVGACHWVTSRGTADGVYLGTKETSTTVTIAAAPGANSRIDVVYVKQNDSASSISPDGSTGELYGVVTGTAAVSPTKPSLSSITGAIELGTVTVAAGATNTLGAGVTIANTAALTVSRGAPIPVRNTTERAALTTFAGLHVIRLDNGGKLERWVSGSTWTTYDALQVPIRSQRLAVTASGTLGSGASVNIAPPEVLPAAPHGTGVPYRIRVAAQIRVDIPANLGAHLNITVGATTYEVDRHASVSGATYMLRGEAVFYISTDTAQTVTVTAVSDAGTTSFTATGQVIIETAPYTAL